MSMRERLARALTTESYRHIFRRQAELERSVNNDWEAQLPLVDAILRELMDLPAKDWFQMEADAGMYFDRSEFDKILSHILNESRDTKDDAA